MADDELEALRRQRLAELQAKHGDSSADPSQQEAKQREAEIRNTILAQVLDQAARARLSNLALVKPDKAKAVENYLIQMARYGQLPGKITEQVLIEILEKASQQTEKTTTVKGKKRILQDKKATDLRFFCILMLCRQKLEFLQPATDGTEANKEMKSHISYLHQSSE
ncbi:programmed cell death protein 5 isoform X2 [Anas acuta]|uniref:Programmed cell death protein 5 n=1 Tax=Anas platyrhynchos TaxID=8839 RepID=A0A8B9TF52_ANAPL|nr:programmed cell death protein 5 isoform X2 [Anas platyrhynchos]|eukprot:XP_027322627.1 programmed cell death protein 5 isoform X2 [Anas platyrhynchos]